MTELILSCFVSMVHASGLIQADSADPHEYKAFLKTQSEFESFADFQARQRVPLQLRSALNKSFARAQRAFLLEDKPNATTGFRETLGFSLLADWSGSERVLIFSAALRLHELDSDSGDNWLSWAKHFDPELSPDSKAFDEKLRAEFRSVKVHLLPLPHEIRAFDQILVNGRPLNADHSEIPTGRHRITLLSNRFKPITFESDAENLSAVDLQLHPLVTGDCQHHLASPEAEPLFVFFGSGCVKKPESASLLPKPETSPAVLREPAPSRAPQWSRNKWLWTGVALLGGYLIYKNNQDSERVKVVPTQE